MYFQINFRLLHLLLPALSLSIGMFFTQIAQASMSPSFANDTHSARFIWQDQHTRLTEKTFTCPALIEPKIKFESVSIYKDTPCRCEIDPVKKEQYDEEQRHVKSYMSQLVKLADQYVATPIERDEIALCIMDHIDSWANSDAMLGDHNHSVGYHKTAEVLGAVSNTYLKIRHNPAIEKISPISEVGIWLRNSAEHVLYFYENIAGRRTKTNNHRYWDGYQIGQAAVILNDNELFQWAMESLKLSLDHINKDNVLPNEMERGSRAFAYHLYAITPIIGLAELAINNPQHMSEVFYPYSYNDDALLRLTRLILSEESGIQSGLFTDSREMRCHESAWLEPYLHRLTHEERVEVELLLETRRLSCNGKLFNTIGGGNFSLMYGQPF